LTNRQIELSIFTKTLSPNEQNKNEKNKRLRHTRTMKCSQECQTTIITKKGDVYRELGEELDPTKCPGFASFTYLQREQEEKKRMKKTLIK
jgi:hypothetical protein